MSRHPYNTKFSDNSGREKALRTSDNFQSEPTGFMETVRPTVKSMYSIAPRGIAIVDAANPDASFQGYGDLYSDSESFIESRFWVAFSAPVTVVRAMPVIHWSTATQTVSGSTDTLAEVAVAGVFQQFDETTITWNTQPDITATDPSTIGFKHLIMSASIGFNTPTSLSNDAGIFTMAPAIISEGPPLYGILIFYMTQFTERTDINIDNIEIWMA